MGNFGMEAIRSLDFYSRRIREWEDAEVRNSIQVVIQHVTNPDICTTNTNQEREAWELPAFPIVAPKIVWLLYVKVKNVSLVTTHLVNTVIIHTIRMVLSLVLPLFKKSGAKILY